MKTIILGNDTKIWIDNFDIDNYKKEILDIFYNIINTKGENDRDVYPYLIKLLSNNDKFDITINNKLDILIKLAIDKCVFLFRKNNPPPTDFFISSWFNVVRKQLPVQKNFNIGMKKMHRHDELAKINGHKIPNYTFVLYIQMPNNLSGEDGVLYIEDKDGKEHYILPKEGDLLIMESHIPHAPASAINSTKNRIVLTANVGLGTNKIIKTLF